MARLPDFIDYTPPLLQRPVPWTVLLTILAFTLAALVIVVNTYQSVSPAEGRDGIGRTLAPSPLADSSGSVHDTLILTTPTTTEVDH